MGGKVGKIVAGIGLIAGGIIVGVLTGQWGLGAAIAIQGANLIISAATAGSARSIADRQGSILENRSGSRQGLPVIYGKTRMGPIMADLRIDASSQNRKRLVVVCSFAHGSQDGQGVESIDEIYLDDKLAWTVGGGTQAPFNTNIDDAGDPHQASEHLKVVTHLGTDSQAVDSILTSLFSTEWSSTSQGKGVCYAVLLLWWNPDVFGGGLPRINAVIRGQKVFDSRTSVTAYSTNPALAIQDYLTAPIYGFEELDADIDAVTFESAADYCDELVTPISGGGSQKRFEIGGWVDTKRAIRANLAELTTACLGTVVNIGGVWKLFIRRVQSATGLEIDPDNTVEGSWQFFLPGSNEAYNSVMVNYIDPGRDYQPDSILFPEPGGTNPLLNDDSGFVNQAQIDLPFTDNRLRAQQIGMVVMRESREAIAVTLEAKEELLQAEVGDVVNLTHPSPGWSSKPFWVVATNYQPHAGVVEMILVEYEPTVYDLTEQFPQPVIDDTGLPDPFTVVAPTGLSLVAGDAESIVTADGTRIVRIKMSWTTAVEPFLSHYEVEAKKTAEADFDSYGTLAREDTQFLVSPAASESWDCRIRSVNTLGVRSAFVSASITPSVTPSILSSSEQEVEAAIARYRFKESDQTLPLGLWAWALDGDTLRLQKNTAVAGDFSTFDEFWTMSPTGQLTLTPVSGNAQLSLDQPTGDTASLVQYRRLGLLRWQAGASGNLDTNNFDFFRYDDSGVFQGAALSLSRSTGAAIFESTVQADQILIAETAAGQAGLFRVTRAGVLRWQAGWADSPDSWVVFRYNDSGAIQGTAIDISRSNGNITVEANVGPATAGGSNLGSASLPFDRTFIGNAAFTAPDALLSVVRSDGSGSTTTLIAGTGYMEMTAAATGVHIGFEARIKVSATTGTINNAWSAELFQVVTGAATISVLRGLTIQSHLQAGSGTTTTYQGIRIQDPIVSAGSIGTAIAIDIDDITTASTNFSIRTGLGDVSFGGPIIVRKAQPASIKPSKLTTGRSSCSNHFQE